mmetsp:Transcript_30443/g.86837  ORF Transcript_30443/g.86837 Transcript_30443/m.86837 type:complete len:233 (+) Transcript_30443:165-863(+)
MGGKYAAPTSPKRLGVRHCVSGSLHGGGRRAHRCRHDPEARRDARRLAGVQGSRAAVAVPLLLLPLHRQAEAADDVDRPHVLVLVQGPRAVQLPRSGGALRLRPRLRAYLRAGGSLGLEAEEARPHRRLGRAAAADVRRVPPEHGVVHVAPGGGGARRGAAAVGVVDALLHGPRDQSEEERVPLEPAVSDGRPAPGFGLRGERGVPLERRRPVHAADAIDLALEVRLLWRQR